MLTNQVGGNGEPLEAGKVYELEDASADHWLKRRKAESVEREVAPEETGKPSDGLTVAQIKEALEAKAIEIPEGVTLKADLAKLLDEAE
uniref:HeH/LEM domain-containing protein n=1 Tax=Variovorax paradoxus (strain S110) TaxID=543728 RepID=C5CJP9_VARPS